MSRRRIGWLAMVVVVVAFLGVGVADDAGPATDDERAQHLAESLMCPTCLGQSVADSDSIASRGIRNYINLRIGEGASDDQIVDELAVSYPDTIVLTPARSGFVGLVWLLPVVALVGAAIGLVLAFRRWRTQQVAGASEADRALVDQALTHRGTS